MKKGKRGKSIALSLKEAKGGHRLCMRLPAIVEKGRGKELAPLQRGKKEGGSVGRHLIAARHRERKRAPAFSYRPPLANLERGKKSCALVNCSRRGT